MAEHTDIGEVLNVPSARVEEFIDLCYGKMNELVDCDSATSAIVRYMLNLSTDGTEKFLAGFILGRAYSMNLTSVAEAEQHERMFR